MLKTYILRKRFALLLALLGMTMSSVNASTVDEIVPITSDYVCVFDNYTGNGAVTRVKGSLFENNYFLDVTGGSINTGKGSIDIADASTYTAVNDANVEFLSSTFTTYGSHLNSLRLKNAQDVIALKPVTGSKVYVFGNGNNKSGTTARIPKFATDASLNNALNDAPGEAFPATANYVYVFEVPEGFDGDDVLYIGSYNGDAFFSFIVVDCPEAPSLYEVAVTLEPENAGSVSIKQTTQDDGTTDEVVVTAYTNPGYLFKEWQSADGTSLSTENPYTFTITADAEIVAAYESTAVIVGETAGTVLVKNVKDVSGCVTKGDNQLIDSSHDGDYITFDVLPTVAGKYSFTSMIGTKQDGVGVTFGYLDAAGNYVESEKKDVTNSGNWNSGENYTWEFDLENVGKLYTFKMLCHTSGSGYCVNVFEMGIERIGDPTPYRTVTYNKGDDAAIEGAVPAAVTLKEGKEVTIPANFTLYKEGYTLTGWSDGTTEYEVGEAMTVTSDVTLTPVFTQNTVSLDNRTGDLAIKWIFGTSEGAATVAWQGGNYAAMVWVTQVEVAGELIDVKMDVDASAGKMNNANRSDYWCQVNGGTKFTVPSYPGAVISMEAYSVVSTTTIGGEAIGGESKTPEYTYEGNESEVEIVINDGSYFRYIQVVLPARELVVTDGEDLTATGSYSSASYVRLFNTEYTYGTICLPFAPDAATCANYTFYKLAEVNSEALIFEEEAAPKANTAYLYKLNDGVDAETAKTFTGGVTTISDIVTEPVGGWQFIGSFAKDTITDLTGGDYWAYQAEYNGKKDVLVKAGTKLVAHPYRAYFKFVPTEELNFTPAAATMRMIIGGKEGGAMEIQEVIAPEQVEGAAFDLEGRPVQEMQKGQIYIIGGKKVKK